MAITKLFLKTKPTCKVTFSLDANEVADASSVALVGDFNNWNPEETILKKRKDGGFSATLTLPVGETVKFRYLVDAERWINDPEADGYEYCAFADAGNSLLSL